MNKLKLRSTLNHITNGLYPNADETEYISINENDYEVFNDFNGNLVNLYQCVRDRPNKLKYKLKYVLNSREDFEMLAMMHRRGIFNKLRAVDRAAKFYQLIRQSYGSALRRFGGKPHSL